MEEKFKIQAGIQAISPSDLDRSLGLVKIHSLPINGLKVCTIFQAFYDFVGPSINMFGQLIAGDPTPGKEFGYAVFTDIILSVTVSLVLQMIQREQPCI